MCARCVAADANGRVDTYSSKSYARLNTVAGGKYMNEVFGKPRFKSLDQQVLDVIRSAGFCHPFTGIGERFPIVSLGIRPFCEVGCSEIYHYAATRESAGYMERMAYEILMQKGLP